MCLGELARVRAVSGDDSLAVESETRRLTVSRLMLDQAVHVGDWVVIQSGFALAVVTDEEARDAMAIRTGVSERENRERDGW